MCESSVFREYMFCYLFSFSMNVSVNLSCLVLFGICKLYIGVVRDSLGDIFYILYA